MINPPPIRYIDLFILDNLYLEEVKSLYKSNSICKLERQKIRTYIAVRTIEGMFGVIAIVGMATAVMAIIEGSKKND